MEISNDKLVELFQTIGQIEEKVGELYSRLIGTTGEGEIFQIKSELAELRERLEWVEKEVERKKTMREVYTDKKKSSRSKFIAVLTVIGDGLYHAGHLAVEYFSKGGTIGK